MPIFQYRGRNKKGDIVTGQSEGATPQKIADYLLGIGVVPVSITEVSAKVDPFAQLRAMSGANKIALLDVLFFSRQMYTMLRAGVPIMQSLDGLLQTTTSPSLAKILRKIRDDLSAGLDLSGAFSSHPEVFSRLFISMVQMGETTGNLADSFKAMGEFLEKEKEIVGRVKGALRYPSFVVIAITLAMFVINIKVIPAFEGMFKSLGKDLPLMTKILVATSHFFVDYWYLLAALIVGSIVGVRVALATPHLRIIWDQHKLALPVFGKLMLWSTLARFSRALAVTSRAGVPIVQALPIVGGAVGNMYVEARVKLMQSQIEQGNAIAKAAASINLFPPLVLQMLQIGEETGQLDELVSEVADFYEREVDYIIKNLSAAIEPILILLIGGMVLVLALGIFMPMWSLIDLAKPH